MNGRRSSHPSRGPSRSKSSSSSKAASSKSGSSSDKHGGRDRDGFIQKGNARYDRHDTYYKKAKKEGFAARSIYKLDEIDHEFHLIKPSARVLDLGCAPGSWLQYVDAKLKSGSALGIDLLPVKAGVSAKVEILQGDAFTTPVEERGPFDVVLSDMAPNTTGIRSVDAARSMALCERALEVAERALKPGGHLCVKILEGGEMRQYVDAVKRAFEDVKIKRPKSTRSGSTETYVIGLRRKARSVSSTS